MVKSKLFCFPYAGGSAAVFSKWRKFLDPAIELCPIELAGRGRRIHVPLYKDDIELVEDVFRQIEPEIGRIPYVFFGHSMGSMIAYKLAQKIKKTALPGPLHVFFSGRRAPHVKRKEEKIYHLMNEEDFRREVLELGGTPEEFFQHPELLDLFLPMLKNDFKLAELEDHPGEIDPLNMRISVFLGKSDDLSPEQCNGWKLHSEQLCSIHYFEGGHFFLHEKMEEMLKMINMTLKCFYPDVFSREVIAINQPGEPSLLRPSL